MAGTSPALTSLTLRRLEHLGHASRESTGEARLLDPDRLMREWAAWYAIKPLKSYRYSPVGSRDPGDILRLLAKKRRHLPGQWALTSMAGASLSAPFATFREVHLHLPKVDDLRRSWQKELELVPDQLGPIHLIQPYYVDSGFHDVQDLRGLPVLADLQLFLDCSRYPVRGHEQAEHILSSSLAARWKSAR